MNSLTLGRPKQTQMSSNNKQHAIGECSVNALLTRYRNGEEDAFHEVINRYKKLLYTFLRRCVDDLKVTEYIFHETFLQLYTVRDRFDSDYSLRTWLITAAANSAKNILQTHHQSAASMAPSPRQI